MKEILRQEFLGNNIEDYAWFIGAILLGLIFKKLISRYLSHLLFKLIKTKDAELGVEKFDKLLTRPIGLCVMLSIIYIGSAHIQFPTEWNLTEYDPSAEGNKIGIRLIISRGFSL